MWALVTDGSITKIINQPKSLVIGDTQYSRNIFSFRWSNAEREAIGLYEVVFDNSNKKSEAYYINTDQSFAFAGGKVTASYGSATAKALADTLFTAQDEVDGKGTEGEVAARGLKFQHKERIKQQASSELANTDWYITRKADAGTAVPSAVTTHRAAVRTKSGEMETAIDNAANVDALAALYQYVNTGTEENPVMERPLGEWPVLEV
jgi:hypothetical protein